jgi:hypothetical protein
MWTWSKPGSSTRPRSSRWHCRTPPRLLACLVATEAMVAEKKPEKKTPPAMPPGGGMDEF